MLSAPRTTAPRRWLVAPALLAWALCGCQALRPSNERDWSPDQAALSHARFEGDRVTVENVRNLRYLSTDDYAVNFEERLYRLSDLQTVDIVVVPLDGPLPLAHTMLSFGFGEEEYLAVSVEIRKERDEKYGPVRGLLRQYELMYVVGDERDLIALRSNHRGSPVYVYRANATPRQVRGLFADVMGRVNELGRRPEFYNTLTNNCTSNMVAHFDSLAPGAAPRDWRVLLTGYTDRWAWEMGLLEDRGGFETTRAHAHVNRLAEAHADAPDFSRRIRRR